jgi:hypothetical protein
VPFINHTLVNNKYWTDSDTTAMTFTNGFDVILAFGNTSNTTDFMGHLSWWVRAPMRNYTGFSGTGLDMLQVLTGGLVRSPTPFFIPKNFALTISLGLTPYVSSMLDFSFSAYTSEMVLAGGSAIHISDIEDAQFCPTGCEDDNTLEISYYVQSPQQWGDGFAKRFSRDLLPSGSFTIRGVDYCPGDFGGASCPAVFKAEIRTEDTFYGMGTPDLSNAGLLGTFDTATAPPITLARRAAFDTSGNPGIFFPGTPSLNLYSRVLFDLSNAGYLVALGASVAGERHKTFWDSSFSVGFDPNGGPDGEGLPFLVFSGQLIMRLAMTWPMDDGFSGSGEVRNVLPTIAAVK